MEFVYLLIVALKLPIRLTWYVFTEVFVAPITTVDSIVAHQCERHALNLIGARKGGRKWRHGIVTLLRRSQFSTGPARTADVTGQEIVSKMKDRTADKTFFQTGCTFRWVYLDFSAIVRLP